MKETDLVIGTDKSQIRLCVFRELWQNLCPGIKKTTKTSNDVCNLSLCFLGFMAGRRVSYRCTRGDQRLWNGTQTTRQAALERLVPAKHWTCRKRFPCGQGTCQGSVQQQEHHHQGPSLMVRGLTPTRINSLVNVETLGFFMLNFTFHVVTTLSLKETCGFPPEPSQTG